VLILFLLAFVGGGVLGVFGPRTALVSAEAGGYRLTIVYPRVTRPGLPIRWQYVVTHTGGFESPVQVSTTFQFLHLLDTTNVEPDPSSQTSTGNDIVWTFEPPPGDTIRVSFDAQTEVGVHESHPVKAVVLLGWRPVVEAEFTTLVIP
jgi:hypothetical protein